MTDAMTSDHDIPAAPRRLGEEMLLDYAAGTLDAPTALMVAAHLDLCPEARAVAGVAETAGGILLDDTAPVPLHDGALGRLFARIDAEGAPAARPPQMPAGMRSAAGEETDALPAPVRARIAERGGRWTFVAPGVRAMDLGFDLPQAAGAAAGGEVRLYRIEPGRGVPTHTHRGSEVTLVLTGAFADGHDRYGPGDIAVATPDVTHRPVAAPGGVCFALAITDAPLKLTGALGLVQRALGGGI